MLTAAGHDRMRALRMADPEADLIRDACPEWRITRMGTGFSAERAGWKTRYATSPELMLAVLAGIERSSHPEASVHPAR